MRKKVIGLLVLAMVSLPVFSNGLGLVFNINYNIGTSDFFDRSETLFQSHGYNFIESKRNKMGMGFNAGLMIPVTSKLTVIPSVTGNFGHQSYQFNMVEGETDTDVNDNYSLFTYCGTLAANYDVLTLKNGWRIVLHLGINYNSFKADNETGIEDSNYWGSEAGIGARFYQVENFGFQAFAVYKYPFSDAHFSYLTLQAGIIYRF